ncbi:MAG: sulfotransferase, partial [Planctomycetota bacterium]
MSDESQPDKAPENVAWTMEASDPAQVHEAAMAALERGEMNEAGRLYTSLVKRDPEDFRARFYLAQVYLNRNDHYDAVHHFEYASRLNPGSSEVLMLLASTRRIVGDIAGAVEAANAACDARPDSVTPWMLYGELLEAAHRLDDADAAFARGAEIEPGHVELAARWSRVRRRQQDIDGALELLDRVTVDDATPPAQAYAYLKERANVLDRLGDADGAFAAAQQANARAPQLQRYATINRQSLPSNMTAMEDARWDLATAAASQRQGDKPVPPFAFVVGLPRSGTTMLGQVLAGHPDVITLDEEPLLHKALTEIGRQLKLTLPQVLAQVPMLDAYAIGMMRQIYAQIVLHRRPESADAALIIDKNPINIIYTPILNILFPEAQIIASRRDIRDVCLSCFLRAFTINGLTIHFQDWQETAQMLARLTSIWEKHRSAITIPVHDVVYEDLVQNFEPHARALFEGLGVPWHDDVLSFSKAARADDTSAWLEAQTALVASVRVNMMMVVGSSSSS